MNPLAWILDSLKVHPEPASIPDVSDLTPIELAEIRSRLQTFSQVATELRRLVDQELAGKIPTALRYGEDIYRPSNGRGTAKVNDETEFWLDVITGLKAAPSPVALIAALFPAGSVRITALPKLAAALSMDADDLKAAHIIYDPPTSVLEVKPISKSAKFLQDMEEGEIR